MTLAAIATFMPQKVPSLEAVVSALGFLKRWQILKIMTDGEAYGSGDIAPLIGVGQTAAFQHMQVLRSAGIIEPYRGRLYRIPHAFLPEPGKPIVDLGHCLLRLDYQPPAPPGP